MKSAANSLLGLGLVAFCWATCAPPAHAQRRPPRRVQVTIECLLEGATVHIDGLPVGTTPLREPLLLEPGEHSLRVSRRGYTDFYEVLALSRKPVTVEADLIPSAGILTLHSSPPQARLSIDGVFVGTTPFDGDIQGGDRLLLLSAPGHHDRQQLLRVIAGQEYSLDLALEPLPPPPEPFYQTWWFWTGVGALTLGATVLTLVLLSEDEPAPDYPRVRLPLGVAW